MNKIQEKREKTRLAKKETKDGMRKKGQLSCANKHLFSFLSSNCSYTLVK